MKFNCIAFKFNLKIRSFFISAFLIRVYTSHKISWAEQITLVRDNFYRLLKSYKNSKSFENLFKFKILKWLLAVICHYFPSRQQHLIVNSHLFLECHPVNVISDDMTYFVRNPVRRNLQFIIALKQDFWFQLNSNNEYFITNQNFFYQL